MKIRLIEGHLANPGAIVDAKLAWHKQPCTKGFGSAFMAVTRYSCGNRTSWSTVVDGKEVHRGVAAFLEGYWNCVCGGLLDESLSRKKGSCKHIRRAQKEFLGACNWNFDFDPSLRPQDGKCPGCGGPLYESLTLVFEFELVEISPGEVTPEEREALLEDLKSRQEK